MSQSLFQWKLFCNDASEEHQLICLIVTILILVETLLQQLMVIQEIPLFAGHNPYFSGNSFAISKNKKHNEALKWSQSLFQWKLFCNIIKPNYSIYRNLVTILYFSGNSFAIALEQAKKEQENASQSLFQWKLFCNVWIQYRDEDDILGHNPYFSGNSFAIKTII